MNNRIKFLFCSINLLFASYSESCINNLFEKNNFFLNNNFYSINAIVQNSDEQSIAIYVEENKRFRIDYNGHIIISDNNKTINYSEKNNQLFIEKKDSLLNKLIFSFNDIEMFYKINDNLASNNLLIYLNEFCTSIDSIIYNNNETKIKLKSITIDTLNVGEKNLFNLDIDESKVFIYDFR